MRKWVPCCLILSALVIIVLYGCGDVEFPKGIEFPKMAEFDWRDKSSSLEGKILDGKDQPLAQVTIVARMVEPVKGYEQAKTTSAEDGSFNLGRLYPKSAYVLGFVSDTWVNSNEISIESADEGKTISLPTSVKIRYMDSKEGTVLDTKTGLMWAAQDNGEVLSWDEAQRYCVSFNAGDYKDWRMPTPDELFSLYDRNIADNKGVHLTPLIKIGAPSFWTSKTRVGEATVIDFNSGLPYWLQTSMDYRVIRVLPVRTAQR